MNVIVYQCGESYNVWGDNSTNRFRFHTLKVGYFKEAKDIRGTDTGLLVIKIQETT